MATTFKSFLNPVTRAYINKIEAAGGTVVDKDNLDKFVNGMARIVNPNLWICWPLRSTQNIGSGSTAYSLGGMGNFDGTMVNGPTWNTFGINFTRASSQRITFNSQIIAEASSYSIVGVGINVNTSQNFHTLISCGNGRGAELYARSNSNTNVASASWSYTGTGTANILDGTYSTLNYFMGINNGDSVSTDYWWNGTSYSSIAGNYLMTQGITTRPCIGSTYISSASFANAFNGNISFGMITSIKLTNTQKSLIYNLYKQTLGQGLGLP